ncbi:ABC transporter permease, partial [Rhizobiaceae sp. 2RAB30]
AVVDLPDADTLFQAVGLPPQSAPQAPPDNVLILPPGQWRGIFEAQDNAKPDTARLQYHVRLDRDALPSQPTDAFVAVTGAARNLEARIAGQAMVANNLGARFDAVRGDALYAAVLFLFLGVPGIALAAALTMLTSAGGSARRRGEQTLLRIRGASTRLILSF